MQPTTSIVGQRVMTPFGPGLVEAVNVDEQGRCLVMVPRATMFLNWKERYQGQYPRILIHRDEMEVQR